MQCKVQKCCGQGAHNGQWSTASYGGRPTVAAVEGGDRWRRVATGGGGLQWWPVMAEAGSKRGDDERLTVVVEGGRGGDWMACGGWPMVVKADGGGWQLKAAADNGERQWLRLLAGGGNGGALAINTKVTKKLSKDLIIRSLARSAAREREEEEERREASWNDSAGEFSGGVLGENRRGETKEERGKENQLQGMADHPWFTYSRRGPADRAVDQESDATDEYILFIFNEMPTDEHPSLEASAENSLSLPVRSELGVGLRRTSEEEEKFGCDCVGEGEEGIQMAKLYVETTPPPDLNKNTEWFMYPGVWTTYILILFFMWLLVLSVFGCTAGIAWTIVNLAHFAITYQFFHWRKGTPFAEDQGIYNNLTWWEQIDNGKQLTRNRKFLTVVPLVLYLIASHTTDYQQPMLFLNTLAVIILVVAKFPNMHKVRIFGINAGR
ncbi:hypothetical protein IEQ34_015479 [Dendrobium chrysotoxum]|uniref:ORM1-like protein n=1 Tax=Dendrobium chrysotoxum TaxID=161865 RepID=A0AAV7GIX2_DENCH|nr:hypothetical protein IEQ34_015479 [Dendrobium chrysotoxum]